MARLFPASPSDAVGDLAREHQAHLSYLHRQFWSSLAADELEEVVQEAYARALAALQKHGGELRFANYDKTRGWFRTIAHRAALEYLRGRDGRATGSGTKNAPRPQMLSLDRFAENGAASDGPANGLLAGDLDVERDLLEAAEREHVGSVVSRALGKIGSEHAQFLRLRYHDALDRDAIMHVQGLGSVKQYEGRHTRAIKALTRALSQLIVGAGCGQLRIIMRHSPELLLGSDASRAQDAHLAGCRPCELVALQLRGALAAVPVPLLAAPVKVGLFAKLAALFGRGDATAGAAASPASGAAAVKVGGSSAFMASASSKAALVIATATVATGGAGIAASQRPSSPNAPLPHAAAPAPALQAAPARAPTELRARRADPPRPPARPSTPTRRRSTATGRMKRAPRHAAPPVATVSPVTVVTPAPTPVVAVASPSPAPAAAVATPAQAVPPGSSSFSEEFQP